MRRNFLSAGVKAVHCEEGEEKGARKQGESAVWGTRGGEWEAGSARVPMVVVGEGSRGRRKDGWVGGWDPWEGEGGI